MDIALLDSLRAIAGESNVLVNEPMKKYTTFKIGGPAEVMVMPHSIEEISAVVKWCVENDIPYIVIGNGSNLLVSDAGIKGVVIRLADNFSDIRIEGYTVYAQAGALLSAIGSRALSASLAGFEFASGIPGTLGGACYMNAGAYGGEMKQVLLSVSAMDSRGNVVTYLPEQMKLSYRSSMFAKKGLTILSAKIGLNPDEHDEIAGRMKDLAKRRRDKQPLELPSAGSTFKRPEGYFAGKLIMDSGLSGYRVGDAAVSEKHCGFVVNLGNATASDVITLINNVSDRVYENFGVRLEPEVRIIGEI